MKKVIRIAFVAAIAGYGVYTNQKTDNVMSELMLANVEALANDENPMCPNGCFDDGDGCLCYHWFPTYREA
ncbi:NVEALA domain-containing protein [uncultured Bacteroides sp.]|jgi:hypothetical protein|uniref:NVEALA domain-containing protein n=1 Tax=uncultured Bacteroides sp. TaxID=162156 RepID=UPI0025F32E36|nr:NVEALA domain-containing protein [uncultured Bacteroides sp.]